MTGWDWIATGLIGLAGAALGYAAARIEAAIRRRNRTRPPF